MMKHRNTNRTMATAFHAPSRIAVRLVLCGILFAAAGAGLLAGDRAQRAENRSGGDPLPPSRAVLTNHNDNYRTGAYLSESQLTPALVERNGMRMKYSVSTNGSITGQLLYAPQLTVNGRERDTVFAATTSNTVQAFDANDGALLWSRTLTDPETDRRRLSNGIQSTPAIDLETNTLYVVFSTRNRNPRPDEDCWRPQMDQPFWLAALDIRTGALLRTVKISATLLRDDGTPLEFYGTNHYNRPALLLSQGSIYVAFGMRFREECMEYHGWVMRYDAQTFAPQGAFSPTRNVLGIIWGTPSSGGGAGIWQGGGGLVGDPEGNVYFTTGNGKLEYETQTYGDSIIKLTPKGDTLEYAASFPPDGPRYREAWDRLMRNDVDLGSGGMMMIPGTENLVGGGKTGIWYLLDRQKMTSVQEFPAFTNQQDPALRDQGWDVGPRLHGSPAYWRGPEKDFAYVYQWSEKDHLKAYKYYFSEVETGPFDEANPVMNTEVCPNKTVPGGMLSISANGNTRDTGIVWAVFPNSSAIIRHQCDDSEPAQPPNRLIAFHAETLKKLWQITLPGRTQYAPPTVADGKILVPVGGRIMAFELNKDLLAQKTAGRSPQGPRPKTGPRSLKKILKNGWR